MIKNLVLVVLVSFAAACGAGTRDQPLAVGGGFEHWRLPGDERVGMVHAEVMFEALPSWWLGPAVYGAVSGQRGGFNIGALAVQRPFAIGPSLRLVPGLAIGGGGGAAAPVGNGLMVHPSLSLQMPLGAWSVGFGLSQVRFTGTEIRSSQWGLLAEWRGRFVAEPLEAIGRRMASNERSGLGFDRIEPFGARYTLRADAPSPRVSLVGARFDRFASDRRFYWGIEAAGAANRASAGYMEVLGQAGAEFGGALRLGARAAVGFGGGGAVPTGGGTIGHLDATLRAALAPGVQFGAALGRVGGRASAMRGTRVELSLSTDLEPLSPAEAPGRRGTVRRVDWTGTVQYVGSVRRADGSKRALETMGLQLNWWLNENGYFTGQVHSAFGGGAGAYSQGLVGAGVATAFRGQYLQIGVEALAGGAGGGGVQSLAGAIAQGMIWAGYQPHRDGAHLRLALGAERSHSGSLSPVLSVGWVVPFAQITR